MTDSISTLNLEAGQVVGGYTLVSRLGGGAMGTVWTIRDDAGQLFAMKILRDSLSEDEALSASDPDQRREQLTARERLRREALALSRVRHPGVASIVDMELDDALAFIVTERIDGDNLREDVTKNGPYVGEDLELLTEKLTAAVEAVHRAGIIHRDIKPTNVMISATGPVLVDFGIAMGEGESHVTRTGLVMGTPGFIAPEVIEGAESDEATDWWSTTSVLAFAATGRPVFGIKPIMAVLEREASGNADLSGLPLRTHHAFQLALSPHRTQRITPRQLLQVIQRDALDAALGSAPGSTGTAGSAITNASNGSGTDDFGETGAMRPFEAAPTVRGSSGGGSDRSRHGGAAFTPSRLDSVTLEGTTSGTVGETGTIRSVPTPGTGAEVGSGMSAHTAAQIPPAHGDTSAGNTGNAPIADSAKRGLRSKWRHLPADRLLAPAAGIGAAAATMALTPHAAAAAAASTAATMALSGADSQGTQAFPRLDRSTHGTYNASAPAQAGATRVMPQNELGNTGTAQQSAQTAQPTPFDQSAQVNQPAQFDQPTQLGQSAQFDQLLRQHPPLPSAHAVEVAETVPLSAQKSKMTAGTVPVRTPATSSSTGENAADTTRFSSRASADASTTVLGNLGHLRQPAPLSGASNATAMTLRSDPAATSANAATTAVPQSTQSTHPAQPATQGMRPLQGQTWIQPQLSRLSQPVPPQQSQPVDAAYAPYDSATTTLAYGPRNSRDPYEAYDPAVEQDDTRGSYDPNNPSYPNDPEAFRGGDFPAPDQRQPQRPLSLEEQVRERVGSSGTMLSALLTVPLALMCACLPIAGAMTALVLTWLARARGYTVHAQLLRESKRGGQKKRRDGALNVIAAPWHLLHSFLACIPVALLWALVYIIANLLGTNLTNIPAATSGITAFSRSFTFSLLAGAPLGGGGIILGIAAAAAWLVSTTLGQRPNPTATGLASAWCSIRRGFATVRTAQKSTDINDYPAAGVPYPSTLASAPGAQGSAYGNVSQDIPAKRSYFGILLTILLVAFSAAAIAALVVMPSVDWSPLLLWEV